jgi:hypothetical protein
VWVGGWWIDGQVDVPNEGIRTCIHENRGSSASSIVCTWTSEPKKSVTRTCKCTTGNKGWGLHHPRNATSEAKEKMKRHIYTCTSIYIHTGIHMHT